MDVGSLKAAVDQAKVRMKVALQVDSVAAERYMTDLANQRYMTDQASQISYDVWQRAKARAQAAIAAFDAANTAYLEATRKS